MIREVHGSMIPIVLAYYGQDEYVPWIANEMKVRPSRQIANKSKSPSMSQALYMLNLCGTTGNQAFAFR